LRIQVTVGDEVRHFGQLGGVSRRMARMTCAMRSKSVGGMVDGVGRFGWVSGNAASSPERTPPCVAARVLRSSRPCTSGQSGDAARS